MNKYEEIFSINLNAIKEIDTTLYNKLNDFEENTQFEAVPIENMPCNIIDTQTNTLFYENTLLDTENKVRDFHIVNEHLFLYFFGIGNGNFIKRLLKNKKLQNITIIEPSLELLFVALHLEDLSKEISSEKLTLFLKESIDFSFIVSYLDKFTKAYYIKSYFLHTSSYYYGNNFNNDYMETNKLLLSAFEFIIRNRGNDIKDALMGLEHHIYNLPRMIAGTQFKEFIKQKNTKTVVMVSTGPSLTKQLPLLKKIQNHTTIICADSALRILHAHDITPDICVSLERIPYVAELFIDLPEKYKKNVIFTRASLEHKSVFDTIKNCNDILIMRPYMYNTLLGLDPYGVLCSGTSVANMAHELAAFMKYGVCIIIGQDLAYGENGITHSKGHILGEKDSSINENERKIKIEAYGGKGFVYTNRVWQLFLNGLRQTVSATKKRMPTINATEGGARIEGTIEMAFSDSIEKYVDMNKIKQKITPKKTSKDDAIHYYHLAQKNLNKILKEGKSIQNKFEQAFQVLAKECKKIESLPLNEQLKIFNDGEIISLLNIIEEVRKVMESNHYYRYFFWDMMQSLVVHYEIELANIKVMSINTSLENKEKAIKWIYNHSHYFYTLAGAMDSIIFTINKAQKESLEELPKELNFLLKQ